MQCQGGQNTDTSSEFFRKRATAPKKATTSTYSFFDGPRSNILTRTDTRGHVVKDDTSRHNSTPKYKNCFATNTYPGGWMEETGVAEERRRGSEFYAKKKIFKTRTRETTVLILSPAFSRMVDMSVD